MKCSNCKTSNPDDNLYCGKCGSSIIDIPKTPTLSITTEATKKEALKFAPGQYFSPRYQIIEEIGRGGMGRVYKAIDKELSRIVALKMIKPERSADPKIVERFKQEIRLASQITHENICRIHDLGEEDGIKYISMQYIDGENLREFIQTSKRLSVETTIDITKQICQALKTAHRHEIVHRDLKPKNIMLDKKGNAYVMDFGLAKSLESEDTTRPGAVVGTPLYMSPEQAEGEKIDHRSDIYALGAIMYEMLTGSPPFRANSTAILIYKHVTETPKPPSRLNPQIPKALEEIILKCLEKKPDKRYQNAEEIEEALDKVKPELIPILKPLKIRPLYYIPLVAILLIILTIGYLLMIRKEPQAPPPVPSESILSIVVLPFDDLSPQKDQQYICDGMSHDIIVKLSQIKGLKVIPATSETLDRGKNILEIAKEKDWFTILGGSYQKEKDDIRIIPLLTNVEDGSLIWSKTYSRKSVSTFEVQEEIAKAIAEALKVELLPDTLEALKSREPKNVEAYEYYLRGFYCIDKKYDFSYEEVDFETGVRMYEKAIEIDPNYALAYCGLGKAYESHFVETKNKKDLDIAIKYLEKAYELDPDLAEANAALGWACFLREDFDRAFQYFKSALEIDPSNSLVNFDTGSFLASMGLYSQAIKYYSTAIEFDPLYIWNYTQIASYFMRIGELEKSTAYIKKGLEIEPDNFRLHIYHVKNYLWQKKYKEAEESLGRAEKIEPDNKRIRYHRAWLLAAKGEKEQALELIKGAAPYRYEVTNIYALLGMNDEAIKCINDGNINGFKYSQTYLYSYPILINNPCYDNLRDEPRFQEIVKKEKKKYEIKLKKYGNL